MRPRALLKVLKMARTANGGDLVMDGDIQDTGAAVGDTQATGVVAGIIKPGAWVSG